MVVIASMFYLVNAGTRVKMCLGACDLCLNVGSFTFFISLNHFCGENCTRASKKESVLRWPFLISPANLMVGILHTCEDLETDTSLLHSTVLCASNAPLVHCKSANHIRTTINNIFQDGETIKTVWTNLSPRLSCDAFLVNNVWVGQWFPRNSKNWPGKTWPLAILICIKWIAEI